MWKSLILLAVLANIFFIKPLEAKCKCSKPNEIYDECPAPCPPQRCDVDPNLVDCKPSPKPGDPECEPGCRCIDGYVLNDEDNCVPREECFKCPYPNEVYDVCPAPCPPQRCDVDEKLILCAVPPKPGDPECSPGCRCINGYVRNNETVCIPKDQCPTSKCPNPNEVYDECPAPCPPRRCDVDDRVIRCAAPPKPGDPECKPGCRCADGYVRDSDGVCVTRDQCNKCTRPHEVYDTCPPSCPPQTCASLGKHYNCPNSPVGKPKCKGACRCEPGYYKNTIGECISEEDCRKCSGPHEYFSCGVACDNVCATLNQQNQTNCPIVNIVCNPMCYCEDGYARDDNNTCIPIDQCPEPKCGENERFEECPDNLCPPQTCSELGYGWPATPCGEQGNGTCSVPPGCVCDYDYVRDEDGKCISKKDCPSCGGDPNAVSGCGLNCGRLCSNYNKGPVPCPRICLPNTCDCKEGFVLDQNTKECVLPGKCTPTCGVNEIYSSCANGGCRRRKCSQPISCARPIKCEGGCICQENYTRADNGTCIPEDQCEPKCGENERFEECPDNLCPPQTCSELGYGWPATPCGEQGNGTCSVPPACVCDNDYVRDKDGKCISKKDCPSCGGDPNAVSGCGLNCGRLCSNYNKGPVPCPRICLPNTCDCKEGFVLDQNTKECVLPEKCTPTCGVNEIYSSCANGGCRRRECSQPISCARPIKCEGGCICQENYTRADNGTCIPEDQCEPKCGENERFEECPDNLCPPQTCSELGYGWPATPCGEQGNGTCSVPPACVCDNDYVRDEDGKCISKKDCPSCGGDPNAVSGCGLNCGRLCSNYNKGPVPCPRICLPNTCDCKEGFVLDQNTKECVLPEKCTPTCGVNEIYSSCANGGCRRRECSQPISCARPIKCEGGCICQENYTRADNGICIPEDQCDRQCADGERYEECPNNICRPTACSQLGYPINCPASSGDPNATCPGEPACICDNDNVRDDDGNCIPKDQCPSCGGDPNAVSGCGVNCGRLCSNYDKGPGPCPKICLINACDCKKGFVLDQNTKKCVLPKNCTPTCGINEVYSNCANGGCRKRTCSKPTICIDPIKCEGGCICQENYTRGDNGTCIPEDQCELQCADDERYEECPSNLCNPTSCTQLGYPNCPASSGDPNATCSGEPACICDNDKVRDDNGNCIPKDQCPSCGGDPNAVSGCGSNCGRRCSNYKQKNVVCPFICRLNGCDCRKGFVYDDNTQKCVRPKDCSPTCGVNEVYDSCANGGCRRRECSQSIVCVRPKTCEGGCICQENYTRADNGTCIPEDQCDRQCADGERYEECPNNICRPTACSQLGYPINCPASSGDPNATCPGEPACICDNDNVRDDDGNCIPKDQCPSCGGDPNAVSGCGVNCGRLCSNYDKGSVPCPRICLLNACDCKKGFVLDQNTKKCVLPKNCTPTCGINEVYSSCANGGCRKRTCSEPTICIDPIKCEGGCICQENYTRGDNGTCIPEDQCELQCADDERYEEECPNNLCNPTACSQLGYPINCPASSGDPNATCPGEPACICDNDNVRDDDGNCIPKDQCPSCGGDPNAVSGCGSNCGKRCSNYKQKNVVCPFICRLNGCDCRKGFVYDDNTQKCVRPKDCSPTCGVNEVYDSCANGGCRRRECSQSIICVRPKKCEGGCICQENYTRADNGACIPENQCDLQCADDEKYEECPNNLCTPTACSQLGYPINCPALSGDPNATCIGEPACICEDGKVRDDDENCIPIDQCPSCGGDPNAVSGCGSNCGRRCSNYKEKNVACPLICRLNGCDCRKGFVYDDNTQKCVRPKQCSPICGVNEVFDTCANGGCDKRNCSQLADPQICIDPIECEAGCVCKKGYLRKKDGNCVPENQCPAPCTKPHEYYDSCPTLCPSQNCEDIGKRFFCPRSPRNNTDECHGQCRCEKGYYRNKIGECISEKKCLKCSGPNEYYSCGPACDNVCSILQKQNQTHCPYKTKKCTPMCYCEEGYARDENKICVPIEQCGQSCHCDCNAVPGCGINCGRHCSNYDKGPVFCPAICKIDGCDCKQNYVYDDNLLKCVLPQDCTPTCGENEVFDECINGGCQKKNCSQIGKPKVCVHPKVCEAGCLCKDGYLRLDNGTCVPTDKCETTCNGDPNAVPGCGVNCGRHCSNYNKEPVSCIQVCYENACDCKEDYVFDDNIGKCVLPEECTPVCSTNEVYDSCANGGCGRKNCSELVKPIICRDPITCIGDCVCQQGYLRNGKGKCVPEHKCKPKCGLHEVYNSCYFDCPPNTCEYIGKALPCPIPDYDYCEGSCVCASGYYRNSIGQCITEEECSKCKGPNEFFSYGGACDNVCATLQDRNQTNCPIRNIKCNSMCYCKDGFARDVKNICIPIEDCPAPTNDDGDDDEDGSSSPPSNVNITDAKARLDIGCIALSGEFIYQMSQSSPDENFVLSASSLLIPLAQITYFSKNKVYDELIKLLNLKSKDEIKSVFQAETPNYENQQNVDFKVATRYYANTNYPLSDNFKSVSEKYFDSSGENVDFSESEESADIINSWVANNTNNKIQELVPSNLLNADTVLVLVNALYFLGNWSHQFNPNATKKRDFTKQNGDVVQLDTMYQEYSFNYAENSDLKIQAVEMPYKNNNFSLFIILPELGYYNATVKALRDPNVFTDIRKKLTREQVQIYLPKMLITTSLDMGEMLKKANVMEMFDPNNDDFKGILKNDDQALYISSIVQKDFIEVNEIGTEAAAATAIGITTLSQPIGRPKVFMANSPFLIYVMFQKSEILFCGGFVG